MKQIRVIAPQGATIRGPAVLALTADQAKRRTGILTPTKGKGRYQLAAGVSAMFKHGEVLGLGVDGLDRLNLQLFEDIDAAEKAAATAKAEAEAKAAAEAEAQAKAEAEAKAAAEAAEKAAAEAKPGGQAGNGTLPLGDGQGAGK